MKPKKNKPINEIPVKNKTALILEDALNSKNGSQAKQTWEDLENFYQTLASSIAEIAQHTYIANMRLIELKVENNKELVTSISSLTKDIDLFVDVVSKIHERHKDKKGEIITEDEIMLATMIFSDYCDVHNKMQALIFYPVRCITKFLMENEKQEEVKEKDTEDGK